MSDPKPTDPYHNPVLRQLGIRATWGDLPPREERDRIRAVLEAEGSSFTEEALSLVITQLRRQQADDASASNTARPVRTAQGVLRAIAEINLALRQGRLDPEGARAQLYGLQTMLSALKMNESIKANRKPRADKARNPTTTPPPPPSSRP